MKIREAQPSDLPIIADYSSEAFKDDELLAWFYPRQNDHPLTIRQQLLQRARMRMVEVGTRIFIAEIDGEIVGHAVWRRTGKDSEAEKWMNDSLFKRSERLLMGMEMRYFRLLDRAVDKKALQLYDEASNFDFYKQLAESGFVHLAGLAVSPKHQRKGIGRALVKWGLDVAAREQVPVTLESSVAGRALYSSLGFVIIENSRIKDDLEAIAMVWEPPALEGRWFTQDKEGNARLKTSS